MAKKTKQDFLALLSVGEYRDVKKRDAVMNARIVAMGNGQLCSRCGGSGHYSFNLVSGTTCFNCQGAGYTAPKLTDKLYAALEVKVNNGELEAWLKEARARAALKNKCAAAADAVMKAWQESGVKNHYDWQEAAKGVEWHRMISDLINKPMCAAYETIQKTVAATMSLEYKIQKAETKEAVDEYKAQLLIAMEAALVVRDECLAIVAEKTKELQQLVAAKSA